MAEAGAEYACYSHARRRRARSSRWERPPKPATPVKWRRGASPPPRLLRQRSTALDGAAAPKCKKKVERSTFAWTPATVAHTRACMRLQCLPGNADSCAGAQVPHPCGAEARKRRPEAGHPGARSLCSSRPSRSAARRQRGCARRRTRGGRGAGGEEGGGAGGLACAARERGAGGLACAAGEKRGAGAGQECCPGRPVRSAWFGRRNGRAWVER